MERKKDKLTMKNAKLTINNAKLISWLGGLFVSWLGGEEYV